MRLGNEQVKVVVSGRGGDVVVLSENPDVVGHLESLHDILAVFVIEEAVRVLSPGHSFQFDSTG